VTTPADLPEGMLHCPMCHESVTMLVQLQVRDGDDWVPYHECEDCADRSLDRFPSMFRLDP
jgi:DNA-directed RNA polymerase subunit M/transcription elongation factor TFIIS